MASKQQEINSQALRDYYAGCITAQQFRVILGIDTKAQLRKAQMENRMSGYPQYPDSAINPKHDTDTTVPGEREFWNAYWAS